jgi:triphosphoribosyl-dephospho-CoA synthase
MTIDPKQIADAFIASCEDELQAPKPGNVHVFAPGHGMQAQDFIDSARASAPSLSAANASVGERILGAIDATWASVDQNTNLGIVLLCAPLAHAALFSSGDDLRTSTARVLAALDVNDAALAFRAIARARPAGLGKLADHDVATPALVTLLEAMRMSSFRDRIAYQYAHDFEDIFETGLSSLAASRAFGLSRERATLHLYLAFLTRFPDTHVSRKFGIDAALALMEEARAFAAQFSAEKPQELAFLDAIRWDESLKHRGLNPGATADLTVSALFADRLADILAKPIKNG